MHDNRFSSNVVAVAPGRQASLYALRARYERAINDD
jgi:hypothetical protein